MAHLIDETTGTAAVAFRGETPWHGLGQAIADGDDLDTIQRKAKLNYEVLQAPVEYSSTDIGADGSIGTKRHTAADRFVLFRSDTKRPLGVVASRYKVHQPREIVGFFRDLVETAGFEIEVAGAIREGKRIWALARVNKEACVMGEDLVRGFLLLSTSYDGSAATRAQYTDVRVVCNNTLTAADEEVGVGRVAVFHSTEFNADKVKDQLGIVASNFDRRMQAFRALAGRSVTKEAVDAYLVSLLGRVATAPAKTNAAGNWTDSFSDAVRESKAYKDVLALFEGGGKGSGMTGASGTAWGLLNAVTEYVDHHSGRTADSRLESAWFGRGASLKAKAFESALALI
jgi:phage/plasmid-like protein (TIGR03299 family)